MSFLVFTKEIATISTPFLAPKIKSFSSLGVIAEILSFEFGKFTPFLLDKTPSFLTNNVN